MALLALSHTPAEHRLYEALLAAETASASLSCNFRSLMLLTGLNSYSTVRRARRGLISKLSIDCEKSPGASSEQSHVRAGSHYRVYRPREIFERRRQAGLDPFPKEHRSHAAHSGFAAAIERVVSGGRLSRREAQVALCCAEGMTNAEIGDKLCITEQTVKFHLRHIFIKFGVRRRAELISRLLRHDEMAQPVAVRERFGNASPEEARPESQSVSPSVL